MPKPMASKLDLAASTLYMDYKPRGNKVERYSAEQREKRNLNSKPTGMRITDKENEANRKEWVSKALRDEAQAKYKAKRKTAGESLCCGDMDTYCDIKALTPTHVVYNQGGSTYGREYEVDIGEQTASLGPKMSVAEEFVFGDSAD